MFGVTDNFGSGWCSRTNILKTLPEESGVSKHPEAHPHTWRVKNCCFKVTKNTQVVFKKNSVSELKNLAISSTKNNCHQGILMILLH